MNNIWTLHLHEDWMKIESKFIKFSVNIVTGEIKEPEGQEKTIDTFMSSRSLRIMAQCLDCNHEGRFYQYSGKVTLIPFTKRSSCVSFLEEKLACDKYVFNQHWEKGYSEITFLNTKEGIPTKTNYQYPLIDLKKTNSKQLEHKLKTYVVFS